jgi:hypothetical protein
VTDPLPANLNLDTLLRSGVAAARVGHRGAARDLFLAITRAYPHDVRAWLGLAGVASSIEEQRAALEHVLALDPDHLRARQTLAQLPPPQPEPHMPASEDILPVEPEQAGPAMVTPIIALPPSAQPILALQDAVDPSLQDLPTTPQRPLPLLNVIGLGIIGLLILTIIVLFSGGFPGVGQRSAGTAPLPSPVLQVLLGSPTSADSGGTSTPAADMSTVPTALIPTSLPTPSRTPTAPTPAVGLPAQANLPLGSLVEVDGWSITLLQPDYALILDGSIGDLRPSGHFVLALMAISNNSTEQRRIPADLFTLVDNRGRRYYPTPNASSAYLALYERGQHGDLALEDSLTPQSGMRSVPILFDVPLDAAGLALTIRDGGSAGWPIQSVVATPVNVGP